MVKSNKDGGSSSFFDFFSFGSAGSAALASRKYVWAKILYSHTLDRESLVLVFDSQGPQVDYPLNFLQELF